MGNRFNRRQINNRDVRQMLTIESEGLTPTGEMNSAVRTRKQDIQLEIVDFQKLCKDVERSM